jgi:FdhD protein
MEPAVRSFDVVRVTHGQVDPARDRVAVELPLEVRLNGQPFSVIMRTPGDDRHLALGFLFTERVILAREDVASVEIDAATGAVDVRLVPARARAAADALAGRRQVVLNSSCGLCGRRDLESLAIDAEPFGIDWRVSGRVVASLPVALGTAQPVFSETGGLHAAGLFDMDGRALATAEDVGRHNAVDKIVGRMLFDGRLPLDRTLLCVSGRSSFEIVQKAWLGGIRLIAAVSAPSSLAIELASESGITLLGFVRDHRFNIYAHAERITEPDRAR